MRVPLRSHAEFSVASPTSCPLSQLRRGAAYGGRTHAVSAMWLPRPLFSA